MDKQYTPSEHEERIYAFWEKSGLTQAPKKGKPYTILMPPPNANASLHAGHGMYVIDDILTRYKRLQGYSSVWVPGMDHAGFETQYVYEKHLAKQKKSRMDFDRQTLYDNIYAFVQENSGLIYKQFKKLGFLADWKKSVFTLDNHVLKRVFETFQRMEKEGLVYRDDYIVNYCTHCGTSLSELETVHIERKDPLYYLKYGPFILATVRPETKFGDTAIAVHPKDKRYKKWVGKEVEVEGLLGTFTIRIIADEMVDMKFGTGVVKITPAHDPHDFEAGKRHGLEVKKVINIDGRLNEIAGPYAGLKVKLARERIVADLQSRGLIEKIDDEYMHSVTVCYKCGRDLEPTIIPNWFIKVENLKKPVIQVIKDEKIQFYPKRYKKQILQWLAVMRDWPISRQITWGIRIPVWYLVDGNERKIWLSFIDNKGVFNMGTFRQHLDKGYSLGEVKQGLQQITVPMFKQGNTVEYIVSVDEPKDGRNWIQETDTFDTWFSSGQWPLVTLKTQEYESRFPTDVMGTLSDILPFWVSRMIMFSLYIRGSIPFRHVYLWSMVADAKGLKMSKSKGNVVNPVELVDKYGADAFRAALMFGVSQGGKVILAEDKVRAMRNFANKIWNIGRLLYLSKNENVTVKSENLSNRDQKILQKLEKEMKTLRVRYHKHMDEYKLSRAFDELYEFAWHTLADVYIEALKESLKNGTIETQTALYAVYKEILEMLHPFIPFVTEAVYQEFYGKNTSIISSRNT